MKGCRTCPNDICIDCFVDDKINYPDITEKEAFYKEMNNIKIDSTIKDKIYCQITTLIYFTNYQKKDILFGINIKEK